MVPVSKPGKHVLTIIGAILGVSVVFLAQQYFFKEPTYEELLKEAEIEINKKCPMMIDDETRLDSAFALPDNVFQYHYSLVNMEKAATDIDDLETNLRPSIIDFVKTNPDMKVNREHKTTFVYSYIDKNKEFLFKIVVTPDLYAR